MKVAVKDANILIDLVEGGFLDAWFTLGIETYTTSLVLNELRNEEQKALIHAYVRSGSLTVVAYSGADLARVLSLRDKSPPKLTLQDCSALQLALDMEAMLLTGDAALRDFADLKQVEVHGTLWILDQLVGRNNLPKGVAAEKLELLMKLGRRLPEPECRIRLRKWKTD